MEKQENYYGRAESESLTEEKTGIYAAAPLDENTAALVTDTKLVIVDINRKHGQKIYDSHLRKPIPMEKLICS